MEDNFVNNFYETFIDLDSDINNTNTLVDGRYKGYSVKADEHSLTTEPSFLDIKSSDLEWSNNVEGPNHTQIDFNDGCIGVINKNQENELFKVCRNNAIQSKQIKCDTDTTFYEAESSTNYVIDIHKMNQKCPIPSGPNQYNSQISAENWKPQLVPTYYDDLIISDLSNSNVHGFRNKTSNNVMNSDLPSVGSEFPKREHTSLISHETISLIRESISTDDFSDEVPSNWSHSDKTETQKQISIDKDIENENTNNLNENVVYTQLESISKEINSDQCMVGDNQEGKALFFQAGVENESKNLEDTSSCQLIDGILAHTPAGQLYEIELMPSKPDGIEVEAEVNLWEFSTLLSALKYRAAIWLGNDVPKSFDKKKENSFKTLLYNEREKVYDYSEEENPFIQHDILFLQKEYKLCLLDFLAKDNLFLLPEYLFSCIEEIMSSDLTKLIIKRHPYTIKTVKKLSEEFCCEGIPDQIKKLYNVFKSVALMPEDKDVEKWLIEEAPAFNKRYEKSFPSIFYRGACSYIPPKKKARRPKTGSTKPILAETVGLKSKKHTSVEKPLPKITKEGILQFIGSNELRHPVHPLLRNPLKIRNELAERLKMDPQDKNLNKVFGRRVLTLIIEEKLRSMHRRQQSEKESELYREKNILTDCISSEQNIDNHQAEGFCDQNKTEVPTTPEKPPIQDCGYFRWPSPDKSSTSSSPRLVICSPEKEPSQNSPC